MASTINDYSLELQWKGDKVTKGIDALEARLNRLAKTASKISNIQVKAEKISVTKRTTTNQTRSSNVGGRNLRADEKALEGFERRRVSMIKETNGQIRKNDALLKQEQGKTGRKAEYARKTLLQANEELRTLQNTFQKGSITSEKALTRMYTATEQVTDHTKRMSSSARAATKQLGVFGNVSKRVGATWMAMGASGLGAYAILGVAHAAFEAKKQYQALDVSMIAAFGSQAEANKQMSYASDVAQKYGLEVFAVSTGWSKIAYSAKVANMPLGDAKQLFEDMSISSRAFGQSAEDTEGTMRAVVQMLSKGKVQAEELRGQLGDRMLGIVPMLAKSMNIDMATLEQRLKAGTIPAAAIAGAFREMAQSAKDSGALEKSLNTLEAKQTRMMNNLKKLGAASLGKNLELSLGKTFDIITKNTNEGSAGIKGFGDIAAIALDMFNGALEAILPMISTFAGWLTTIHDFLSDINHTPVKEFDALDPVGKALWITIGLINDCKTAFSSLFDMLNNGTFWDNLTSIEAKLYSAATGKSEEEARALIENSRTTGQRKTEYQDQALKDYQIQNPNATPQDYQTSRIAAGVNFDRTVEQTGGYTPTQVEDMARRSMIGGTQPVMQQGQITIDFGNLENAFSPQTKLMIRDDLYANMAPHMYPSTR